jgi:hypothetical protein
MQTCAYCCTAEKGIGQEGKEEGLQGRRVAKSISIFIVTTTHNLIRPLDLMQIKEGCPFLS